MSLVAFAAYGYADANPDPLDRLLADAVAEFHGTCRLRDVEVDFANAVFDTTDGAVLTTLLDKALRMWVEWLAAQQPEHVDTAADFDLLSSRSSGPATENRRSVASNSHMLHVWPALDRILRYILKLWNEEITPSDLPPDVPALEVAGPLPRPGEWIMDRAKQEGLGVFGELRAPGVHRVPY